MAASVHADAVKSDIAATKRHQNDMASTQGCDGNDLQLECEECIEDIVDVAQVPASNKTTGNRSSLEPCSNFVGRTTQQPWNSTAEDKASLPAQGIMVQRPLKQELQLQKHTSQQLQHIRVTLQQAPQQQQQHFQSAAAVQQAAPGSSQQQQASAALDHDAVLLAASSLGSEGQPYPGYVSLLALHDFTSAMPFAPKSFISNDGTTIAPSSQRRRLSVAIPGGSTQSAHGNASSGGQGLQSPVGGMMASLMAETAPSGGLPTLNTPWSAHNPNLVNLLSPNGTVLDVNELASPRATALSTANSTLESSAVEQAAQQLLRVPSAALAAEPPRARPPTAAVSVAGQQPTASQQGACGLVGRKRTYSASFDDGRCAEICNAAQAAAFAAMGSPGTNPSSDLAALAQWQHTIEAAEQQWGPSHPAVGRAWLELARALQAVDKDSERAKLATKKAFDICQILLKQTAMESRAQESFQYLLDKFNRKATAAKQAAQTAAAYAAQEAATAAAAEASSAAAAAAAATVVSSALTLGFKQPESMAAAAIVPAAVQLQQQQYQQQMAYAAFPMVAQPGVSEPVVFAAAYPTALLQPNVGSLASAPVAVMQVGGTGMESSSAQHHAAASAISAPRAPANTAAVAAGSKDTSGAVVEGCERAVVPDASAVVTAAKEKEVL